MLSKKRNILLIRFPCNSVSLSRPSFSTKRFERLALGRGIRLDGSTETEMHDTRLNRRGWVAVTSVASVSSVCQIRGEEGKEGWIPYPGQSAAQRPANPQLSRLPDKLRKEWCIERVNGATSSRGPPTPDRPHPRNQGVFLRLVWRRGRNVCPQQPPITPIVFHGRKQSVRGHVVTLPPLTTISTTSL